MGVSGGSVDFSIGTKINSEIGVRRRWCTTHDGSGAESMGDIVSRGKSIEPEYLISKIVVDHDFWDFGIREGGGGASGSFFDGTDGSFNVTNMFATGSDFQRDGMKFGTEAIKLVITVNRSDTKTSSLEKGNKLLEGIKCFGFTSTLAVVEGMETDGAGTHKEVWETHNPEEI